VLNVQRLNAQQTLNQRMQTARRLRDLAQQNENQRLVDAADRMEQNAQQQYEKRTAKINQQSPEGQLSDQPSADKESAVKESAPEAGLEPGTDAVSESQVPEVESSTLNKAADTAGREKALQQQVLKEERTLRQRMDTAQKLRDIGKRNGNDQLLETADRMEQSAMQHFEKRLEKLNYFEDGAAQPSPVDTVDLEPVSD
jgi:hypothetical protein